MLLARKYDLPNYDKHFEENRHQRNKKVKKKAIRKKTYSVRKILSIITVFFAVGFFIVLRHVSLSQMANTVAKQKDQISSLEKINSQLKTETVVDISKVDDIARNKLGMDRPYKYQMVYVNLENNNINSTEKENNLFEYKIVNKISKVVEYFY